MWKKYNIISEILQYNLIKTKVICNKYNIRKHHKSQFDHNIKHIKEKSYFIFYRRCNK